MYSLIIHTSIDNLFLILTFMLFAKVVCISFDSILFISSLFDHPNFKVASIYHLRSSSVRSASLEHIAYILDRHSARQPDIQLIERCDGVPFGEELIREIRQDIEEKSVLHSDISVHKMLYSEDEKSIACYIRVTVEELALRSDAH